MKKLKEFHHLFLVLVLSSAFNLIFAQESILEKFSVTEFDNKVLLSWTVKSGNTCNGIRIYRSSDSLIYSEIGDIQGVCGSAEFSVHYSFTDNQPVKNSKNYYRLNLGGIEVFNSSGVEVIDVGKLNYFLKSNPIVDKSDLHFNNSSNKSVQLHIFAINGILLQKMTTLEEMFTIDAISLPNGLYYFQLSTENNQTTISDKFQVVH